MPTKQQIEEVLKKDNLTPEDHSLLESYEPNDGTDRLYSFFTPIWLCEVMYKLAIKNGFNEAKGKILEPAIGTGNFLTVFKHPKNAVGFELDPLNFQIAKKRVPEVQLYNNYFETAFLKKPRFTQKLKTGTWLKDYPFDLVIGNPPYGQRKDTGFYYSYFTNPKFKQTEIFFMYKSMQLLKSGGLLVFITASSFMRNESYYKKEKDQLSKIADFVDAYRMPKVFKNTAVPTDILIFRKK